MGEIYRFRTIEQLLGEEYQELERQAIYFSSPDQLNDPMEGFRDIVWRGDSIAWTNLFKHYVFCLHRTFLAANFVGDSFSLTPDDIPIFESWDDLGNSEAEELFIEVWSRAVTELKIVDLASNIAQLGRKVRLPELMLYLNVIHLRVLGTINEVCIDRGYLSATTARAGLSSSLGESLLGDSTYFQALRGFVRDDSYAKLSPDQRLSFMDTVFSIPNQYFSELFLAVKYDRHRKMPDGAIESNNRMLMFNFQGLYLKAIAKLLWPQWYAACFTRTYSNSSMWGNYATHHEGVCLIFDADDSEETPGLVLKKTVGCSSSGRGDVNQLRRFVPMTFSRVSYEDRPSEVDFFRSIGTLPEPTLMKLWYTDDDGNISECAAHITGSPSRSSWQEIYWKQFEHDIVIKTKDWRHEEEERLVLHGLLDNTLGDRERTTTYRFTSLVGIIFGIMTSDEDKLKVMEVIERKCRENGRTDFRFHQAYYSHEDGDIQRSAIGIEFG